jgi:hypothetical protein
MAHIKWGSSARPLAVNFLIKEGLRPDAILKLTADTGAIAELVFDNAELMRLVAGIQSDPRFRIETRAPKRDQSLDGLVDDLLSRSRG